MQTVDLPNAVATGNRRSRSRSSAPRIGLLGPYASRNLGDTAIQLAVMNNLRERCRAAEIVGICPDPLDTVQTHGIEAFPLSGESAEMVPPPGGGRRGARLPGRAGALWNIAALVRSLDLLIISGSGQLDDFWGGPWGHPFALLQWTAAARLHGVKVAVFGVGLDQLSTRLGRQFALGALRLAHFRAFRDSGTLAALEAFGFDRPSLVCPDPAFSLPPAVLAPESEGSPPARPFVVVSPISEKAWLEGADESYRRYLRELAATCDRLVRLGLTVRFVCSQQVMDVPVVQRVLDLWQPSAAGCWELHAAPTVARYVGLVRGARVVIASRLHALILALAAGEPVIAVSYGRKVTQLMRDMALQRYDVDLPSVGADALIGLVEEALADQPRLRTRVAERTSAYRHALAQAYDAMLAVL